MVFFCGFVWGFFCLFSSLFTTGRNQLHVGDFCTTNCGKVVLLPATLSTEN